MSPFWKSEYWYVFDIGILRIYEKISNISHKIGDAIFHRGPDKFGLWIDASNEISFIHRRLSILDLSDAGSQPMISPSQRYVISYNGEIYNH